MTLSTVASEIAVTTSTPPRGSKMLAASNTFGLVFTLAVDDHIRAQPLYVPNVAIPSQGTHNVLYVATMSDTLYAFDADAVGTPLWSVNLASLFGTTAAPWANFAIPPGVGNGNLGILTTPVIDPTTNLMYVLACTLENSTMAYRLHAIDITTGAEPLGPGVLITASYGGYAFDAPHQTQRMSLVLSGNQVVFGFGAMAQELAGNYGGWVMAYNKQTLQQSGVFATVSTGNRGGGVWQSERPPAIDSSGYVYVFAGNGYGQGYDGVNNFSESVLKLDPANGLTLLDWFTPGNWSYLDAHDLDLSSSGPLLIPGTTLLAGGGKTGDLYVLNTTNLGKFSANDSQVVQKENISVGGTSGGGFRGGPVYWQRSAAAGGPLLYNWGVSDVLKAYPFSGSTFASSPSAQGGGNQMYPGGILALSANGEQHGSGVLWASTTVKPTGELHAFDAENISTELWNSTMNSARDGYGNIALLVPPVIANGKVYMATGSKRVAVYRILASLASYTVSPTSLAFGNETTRIASAPMLSMVTNTGTVALPVTSITVSGTNHKKFSQTNTCGMSVAVGSNCTISVVFKPTATGSMTATLEVIGGNGAGTQTVALTGTGVAPTYTVSPTSLAFGSQPHGTSSTAQSVTVTNTATVALPITSITLSGTSYKQFSQTNTCGTSVPVGSNCMISVVFKPTATGSMTATLNIKPGGGAGAQTAALSATGT